MQLFGGPPWSTAQLVADYLQVRRTTEQLCAPLATEDYMLQAMPDASPTKWHIAHVSWFFETFVLKQYAAGYKVFHPQFEYLFNSYYNAVGPQFFRPNRSHLSRPTVKETYAYRAHVDQAMVGFLEGLGDQQLSAAAPVLVLGLNHEQQHQELILTDIKYNLSVNPLRPAYHGRTPPTGASPAPIRWQEFPGGLVWTGHEGPGFSFDNEEPRHQTFLQPYALASRLATNGEYLEFMEQDGYKRPELWLSLGWQFVQQHGWEHPLYWERIDGRWWMQTLAGMQPVDEHAPVTHISFCEADAFARWRNKRLPTEQEWEQAAVSQPVSGNFMGSGYYQPVPLALNRVSSPSPASGPGISNPTAPAQMYGDVWEWTSSPYQPYPGFKPPEGALGEYNGKFMLSQMVLRGGSCATPRSHIRASYRNFFPPDARWQFSGIRLAADMP